MADAERFRLEELHDTDFRVLFEDAVKAEDMDGLFEEMEWLKKGEAEDGEG